MQLNRITNAFAITAILVLFLVYAKDLLIPFVLAVFIWFIIREIRIFIRRNKFIREKVPTWLENILSSLILFGILGFVVNLLLDNINYLSQNLPAYEKNIKHVSELLEKTFKLDLIAQAKDFTGGLLISDIIGQIINAVSSILGNTFIVLIYLIFLLMEEAGFDKKLDLLFSTPAKASQASKILHKIDHSIGRYISMKTLISSMTGLCSFVALKIIGVDAPLFWAFIIFSLDYIPNIGALFAAILPTSFALLQYGTLAPALWVLFSLGAIQLVIGNFIEPKIMGNSLNLSSLVVILTLSLWGALWGIVGMIISVPITVIMLIFFSEFPATRNIAIILSEKGKID